MEYTVIEINPHDHVLHAQMDALLEQEGISRDQHLDCSMGVVDENGALVATGSCFQNTLRCMAVDKNHQGENLLGLLTTHLTEYQMARGFSHLFLFTKCDSARFFEHLGFWTIETIPGRLVFMENRKNGFAQQLRQMAGSLPPVSCPRAAIVMNANPFSSGHQALLARAAKENAQVIVFVVSEDCSLIPFADRFEMVRRGADGFQNVCVIPGGDYIISSATFPSYFLKESALVTAVHAQLDAQLFVRIAQALSITRRYAGEEPFSQATAIYNDTLADVLPEKGIEMTIVPRTQALGVPISASHIRQLIHDGQLDAIRPFVPDSTFDYLSGAEGRRAIARIMASDDVIHH